MKQIWVGTGWKMNHLLNEALDYATELKAFIEGEKPSANIFICVPFTVINAVSKLLEGSDIWIASQNVHWADRGAATGEISALMVKDAGATMAEIGHSERRISFCENDVDINKKLQASFSNQLKPILCVGESRQEKDFGVGVETISKQLKIALRGLSVNQIEQVLIAYEPVWAIGDAGAPAAPDYLNYMHAQIAKILCEIVGSDKGNKIPIIYGGSVNADNALSLISLPEVNGLFIGRAAWSVAGFINIIRIVEDQLKT